MTPLVEPIPIKDSLKVYADTVPEHLLNEGAKLLVQRERATPIEVEIDRGLRLKVIDTCGHACVFCHNEGTQVNPRQATDRVSVFLTPAIPGFQVEAVDPDDPQFVSEILRARDTFNLSEVHLTGGEPTQHPRLPDLVRRLTEMGLQVKMTSNGESGALLYEALGEAGLKSVSVSIFGSTPEEYAATQPTRFNTKWAARKLERSRQAIAAARKNGITVKSNCVMSDMSHIERVMRLIGRAADEGFDLRILNDLGRGDESVASIYNLLAGMNAVPIRRKLTAGVSGSVSYYRLPSGQTLGFKQIRRVRLPAACKDCDLDANGKCEEGYYGLRLYKTKEGPFIMGVCIQRMDLAQPTDDFYSSDYPGSINALRDKDYQNLCLYSAQMSAANRSLVE